MQSVLQYRRFEKRLREQIQRHGLDRTSGVRGSIQGQVRPYLTTAAEPKDVEAGPARLVARRDHAFEEKEISDCGPIPPRRDEPVLENAANREENLSGSTTRSSSTSTADSLRPDLSTATTQDTTGEPYLRRVIMDAYSGSSRDGRRSRICSLFIFEHWTCPRNDH
jgi:hypothetical protein